MSMRMLLLALSTLLILPLLSFPLYATAAPASNASIPLGVYAWNPNGNDASAMKTFEQHMINFTRVMGRAPTHMDTFIDFTHDWDTWVPNAQWTAWSWSLSNQSKSLIPVVGIPMLPGAMYSTNVQGLTDVVNGVHDSVFFGIAQAFRDRNFSTIHARVGWEANGNWYAWTWNGKNSTGGYVLPLWIQAFQHIATVLRSVPNMNVLINWNPCVASWSPFDVQSAYPGDKFVDVISLDIYSTVWPSSLYDWAKDDGTIDANVTQFIQSPINRMHVWDYPAATQWEKQSLGGWGMVNHLQFARSRSKPVALCETGDGINPSYPLNGLDDDLIFPTYLRSRLDASGVPVAYVNIWDVDAGDGHCQFSDGTKPLAAAAWRQAFGDGK